MRFQTWVWGRLEATAWIHVAATNKTNELIKGDDDVDE